MEARKGKFHMKFHAHSQYISLKELVKIRRLLRLSEYFLIWSYMPLYDHVFKH